MVSQSEVRSMAAVMRDALLKADPSNPMGRFPDAYAREYEAVVTAILEEVHRQDYDLSWREQLESENAGLLRERNVWEGVARRYSEEITDLKDQVDRLQGLDI